MAAFQYAQTIDLNNPRGQSLVQQINGHVGDALAHTWKVTLVRGSSAEDLTGYTAMALHNRKDGATLEIVASISGNVVTVTFPQASYIYEGQGQTVLLRLTKAATSEETVVAGAQLNVGAGETGTPTDPSTTIPTLSALLAQIDAANDAAAAANDAADYANGIGAGLDARTGAVETAVADHTTRLSAAESTIAGHTTQLAEKAKRNPLGLSLIGSMVDGRESMIVCVLGDSTGVNTYDFPRLLATKLAAEYPGYNVKYALFDSANARYPAWTDVQLVTERSLRFDSPAGSSVWMMPLSEVPLTSPDLDVEMCLSLDDWQSGTNRTLISRWGGVAGTYSWKIHIDTNNYIYYSWCTNGTTMLYKSNTTYLSGLTNEKKWIRVTHDVDNGAGHSFVTFYTSTDGVTWTQFYVYDTVGATAIYDSTTNYYEIGGYSNTGEKIKGNIYAVRIRDGIGGRVVNPQPIDTWKSRLASTNSAAVLAGAPTIYLYNGSISGKSTINFAGDLALVGKIIPKSYSPHVIINLGHNDTARSGADYLAFWDTLINGVKALALNPMIAVMTQNPEGDDYEYTYRVAQAKRRRQMIAYAAQNGLNIVDDYLAMLTCGTPLDDLLNADKLHPNAAGGLVILDALWSALDIGL